MTFPPLPPAAPAVDDPGHVDDHGLIVGALEHLRDNYVPALVADSLPDGTPFGTLWLKPKRTAGEPVVLHTASGALPSGNTSYELVVDVPAGTTGLYLGHFWTPQAPFGAVTMNGTPLEAYASAQSGSTSTDRAVALYVIPSPPSGPVSFVTSGSAAIARGLGAVCVGGTNPDAPAGAPQTDGGTGRSDVQLTPAGLPFVTFGIGRGAAAMTRVGAGSELEQWASGSTTRCASGWHAAAGAGGWQLAAADSAAIVGAPVVAA